jgi:hypothetical protein
MQGGCACGAVRYRLTSEPLFIHCCHCLSCQRQTGSAFVINLLIERDVDGDRLPRHLDPVALDQEVDHEGAAGLPLAAEAVAAMDEQRLRREPIANRAARAPAFHAADDIASGRGPVAGAPRVLRAISP